MLSPFIPAPSSNPSSNPAKSSDLAGNPKPESASNANAPAPGTSFQDLLARKTTAPAAKSQGAAHANFHAKAQAQSHHNSNANYHAEAHTNSRNEPKDKSPSDTKDSGTSARDAADKPVDYSINRRMAKSAEKSAASASGTKAGDTDAAAKSDASAALDATISPVEEVAADPMLAKDAPEDATPVEDPALPALPLLAELPQPTALPIAPVALGLPTAVTPAPVNPADSASVDEAVADLANASSAPTNGTPNEVRLTGNTTSTGRAGQAAAAKSPATFAVSASDASATKTPSTPSTGLSLAGTAGDAVPTEAAPATAQTDAASADIASAKADTASTGIASAQADARQSAGAYGLAAQIADPVNPAKPAAAVLSAEKIKNINQSDDAKEVKKSGMEDGIRRAYELPSMSTTTPVFQAPTASVQTLGPVNANSPVAPTIASTAVRMVEKVSEVADHLAANPAEQVTVRIDLDATHRVDVHVSMRGGQVHADFRSDSADMRAALASAWKEFSQGREGTDRQWAAPVFSPMAAPAAATSFTANQQSSEGSPSFGPGQDSAQRQAAEREAQSQGMGNPTRAVASTTASATAVAEVKTPIVRSENSQHLSVLA